MVHFEIIRPDPIKLQRFYADLFQLNVGQPAAELGNYAMVTDGSSGVPVGIGQDPSGTARTTAYVQVPDLQASLDRAAALGAKVVVPPTEIPGVLVFAMFADSAGNQIGLVKG